MVARPEARRCGAPGHRQTRVGRIGIAPALTRENGAERNPLGASSKKGVSKSPAPPSLSASRPLRHHLHLPPISQPQTREIPDSAAPRARVPRRKWRTAIHHRGTGAWRKGEEGHKAFATGTPGRRERLGGDGLWGGAGREWTAAVPSGGTGKEGGGGTLWGSRIAQGPLSRPPASALPPCPRWYDEASVFPSPGFPVLNPFRSR